MSAAPFTRALVRRGAAALHVATMTRTGGSWRAVCGARVPAAGTDHWTGAEAITEAEKREADLCPECRRIALRAALTVDPTPVVPMALQAYRTVAR